MTSTQRFWKQKFSSLKNISTHNKGTILHIKLKEQIMMPKLQISCKLLIRMVYRSTSTYLGLRFRLGSLTHTAGYAAFTFTQAIMKDNTGGYLKMYWIPHLLKGTPKEEASNHYEFFLSVSFQLHLAKQLQANLNLSTFLVRETTTVFNWIPWASLEMFVAMPQLELL